MEHSKECPQCRRISPAIASRCDCGFRFAEATSPSQPPALVFAPSSAPAQQSRWEKAWWPRIDDEASARKAARQGMWLALLQAGVTSLFATMGIAGFSFENYTDVLFLLVLTWGFHRMSRAAAVLAILYYVVSQVVIYSERPGGMHPNVVVLAFFLLAYLNGLRGTVFYHNLRGSRPVWKRVLGALGVSIVLCSALFAWAMWSHVFDLPDDPTRDTIHGAVFFFAALLPWPLVPLLFGSFVHGPIADGR